jgi:hypothetical protein
MDARVLIKDTPVIPKRRDLFDLHNISPIRMRKAHTLAVTDPIQIEEGSLSLPLLLLAWLTSEVGEAIVVELDNLAGVVMVVKVVPKVETVVAMIEALTLVTDGDEVVMMFDGVDDPTVGLVTGSVCDGPDLDEVVVGGGGCAHVFWPTKGMHTVVVAGAGEVPSLLIAGRTVARWWKGIFSIEVEYYGALLKAEMIMEGVVFVRVP